jgi:hypothetical protein
MGQGAAAVATWLFGLAAIARGFTAFSPLVEAGATVAANWRAEAAVRTCALAAAGEANLLAAGEAAANLDPLHTGRLDAAAAALADALRKAYLDSLQADAAGRCRADQASGFAASLHEQRHSGQPTVWPNWVPRYALE